MREWTPEMGENLDRLIRAQNRLAFLMWWVRPVAEVVMWLGMRPPRLYLNLCRSSLEVYEAQAKLLGIR